MKKYIIIVLLIIIFITGIWLLNNFGVISLKALGEKALTKTPFLEKYVKTDQAYDEIDEERNRLYIENQELKNNNLEINSLLSEANQELGRQAALIVELNEEISILQEKTRTEEERLNKLIQIYGKMAPEEAARIFSTLEEELTLQLLYHLKESQAAEILSKLPPDKAAELSKAMQ